MTEKTLTIRLADAADAGAVARLAALDSASPPTGETLLAELGGELWAAVEVESGATIADPFRPSADVADLLRQHAATARSEALTRRPVVERLAPRAA
jgi:hypothetical protein